MYLGLNTFVYEIAKVPIEKALQSASQFGFRFIEYAAYHSGDPTLMNKDRRNEVVFGISVLILVLRRFDKHVCFSHF